MNFFEHQDNARQQTRILVGYFLVAILIIILAVNVAGFATWLFTLKTSQVENNTWLQLFIQWFQTDASWMLAIGALALILFGSILQWFNLSGGGPAVAKMVGARAVSSFKNNEKITQFIHVVEEMSIASGTPVPQLYVMEREPGINAFVAGYQIEDTVMVVTQGLLDNLDRNEIQAVSGHEFSHIFNGDMRLNMRLISLLSGILMIGQFGRFLMETGSRSSRSFRSNKNSGGLPLILGGLVVWLIGSIGVFFGRLIKSAVSRQREFLADASAVQFTRNPDALASALHKIQEHTSVLHSRHAEDMSHLCIGTASKQSSLFGNLATHPPLLDRINRVAPTFLTRIKHARKHDEVFNKEPYASSYEGANTDVGSIRVQPTSNFNAGISAGAILTSEAIINGIGQSQNSHLVFAKQLHQDIPDKLKTLLHQSTGAKGFCFALILREIKDNSILEKALSIAEEHGRLPIKELLPWVRNMPVNLRLPCIDICMPTLKQLEHHQRLSFIKVTESMAKLDNNINTTEWLLISQLRTHLLANKATRNTSSIGSLKAVNREVQILLSALVYTDSDLAQATTSYQNAINSFNLNDQWLMSREAVGYTEISMSLWRLKELSYLLKRPLLQACTDIVLTDALLSTEEYELLRVISDALRCPLPPLVDSLASTQRQSPELLRQ